MVQGIDSDYRITHRVIDDCRQVPNRIFHLDEAIVAIVAEACPSSKLVDPGRDVSGIVVDDRGQMAQGSWVWIKRFTLSYE